MIRNILKYKITTGIKELKGITSLMFQPQKQSSKQIVPVNVSLNDLVPDFFTNDINSFQLKKVPMSSMKVNSPSNSFIRYNIPLKNNPQSRLPFERLGQKRVRIGRILQLMDSLAGISMTKFANASALNTKQFPFTIATACIDNIFLEDNITCEQDIVMQSNINFVGATSAQIQVNVMQNQQLKASAYFTMVSRESGNIGKGGKGYKLPSLVFDGQDQVQKCIERQKRGQQSRKIRLQRAKKSLQVNIPTHQQIAILHEFFLERDTHSITEKIPMSSAITYRSLLMHSQYRNMNHKIFGGFLMRQMVETAFIAARKFACNSNILFQRIEDIFFIQPVQIGEGVDIKAQVVYSDGIYLVIKVQADKIVFHQGGKKIRACQLYITFQDTNNNAVPKLFPQTYGEGIQYLMGRRVLIRSKQSQSTK